MALKITVYVSEKKMPSLVILKVVPAGREVGHELELLSSIVLLKMD